MRARESQPERNTNLERQALEKNSGRASPRPIIYDLGSHVTPHCCQTLFVGCTWGWLRALAAPACSLGALLRGCLRLPLPRRQLSQLLQLGLIILAGRLLFFWLSHTSAEATSLVASFRAPGGGAAGPRPKECGVETWVQRGWVFGVGSEGFSSVGRCGSVSCCCYRGGTEHSVCFIGFGAWQNYFQINAFCNCAARETGREMKA